MEYIDNIIEHLIRIFSMGNYFEGLGLVPAISIATMGFLFLLEVIFYLLKRPRGLSNLILVIGILGTFATLYVALVDIKEITEPRFEILSAQLLSCALVGIIGGVLAALLSIFEALYYSNVDASRSIDASVKALFRLIKGDIGEAQKNLHLQLHEQNRLSALANKKNTDASQTHATSKAELQHISQQIYDLTHHLKQELNETREKSDKNTEQLIEGLKEIVVGSGQNSSTMGPKVVAKTSVNSQQPPSNDSSFQFLK